jgi:hypothetical protein
MELKEFIEKSIHDITTAIHSSSEKMNSDKTGKGIPDVNRLSFVVTVEVNTIDSKGFSIYK